MKPAQLWEDPRATATALLFTVLQRWGVEALEAEPETLKIEISTNFGKPADNNFQKLLALISALTSNLFYVDPVSFNIIANSLSGDEVDFRRYNPLTPLEAAWALLEVRLNDPASDEEWVQRFSPAVLRYLQIIRGQIGEGTPLDIANVLSTDSVGDFLEGAEVTRQVMDTAELKQDLQQKLQVLFAQLARLLPDKATS